METVRWRQIAYGDRTAHTAVRGVEPVYGEIRNEVPSDGRWLSPEDYVERRRVAFLGSQLRKKLFAGRPAVGETIRIDGMRFTVVGAMDRKMQMSNYFTSDDECAFIPYTTAGDLWDTRYSSVLVFSAVDALDGERPPSSRCATRWASASASPAPTSGPSRCSGARSSGRSSTASRSGCRCCSCSSAALTLGIGGVGVANIMLVSVDERVREIGLRRALGARKRHIRLQFLAEALVLTLVGGAAGIVLAYAVTAAMPILPLLGPLYEDTSGKGDLKLAISGWTVLGSTPILVLVGVLPASCPPSRPPASTRWRRSDTSRPVVPRLPIGPVGSATRRDPGAPRQRASG